VEATAFQFVLALILCWTGSKAECIVEFGLSKCHSYKGTKDIII
jgi:hypothetical protein